MGAGKPLGYFFSSSHGLFISLLHGAGSERCWAGKCKLVNFYKDPGRHWEDGSVGKHLPQCMRNGTQVPSIHRNARPQQTWWPSCISSCPGDWQRGSLYQNGYVDELVWWVQGWVEGPALVDEVEHRWGRHSSFTHGLHTHYMYMCPQHVWAHVHVPFMCTPLP